jgi:hypothetical protein
LIFSLLVSHIATKAFIAWNALHSTHRFRANLLHEIATPIEAHALAGIYRTRARRENRISLIALIIANALIFALLLSGAPVPATFEEKFALCFALAAGVGLLFLDASALFWNGLLRGATSDNLHQAFSISFGAIVGIPWAVAWVFAALRYGEAITLNEIAAYFLLWTLLGGTISWIAAATAKSRFEREIRTLLAEP